jgi:hypothetical protein
VKSVSTIETYDTNDHDDQCKVPMDEMSLFALKTDSMSRHLVFDVIRIRIFVDLSVSEPISDGDDR